MSLQDKIRDVLANTPRWALLLPVPVVAFLVATAVALGFGIGGDDTSEPVTVRQRDTLSSISADNLDLPPTLTPVPTEAVEEADPTNRKDCDAIRGTDYLSPGERDWYLENCTRTTDTVVSNAPTNSGNQYVAASEYSLGERLVIPSIGVDIPVTGAEVSANGQMPDPVGYFNAVRYKFTYHPGVGHKNIALAAHVDCAACHNGGPGVAAFYSISKLASGANVTYYFSDGSVGKYVVRSVASYAPGANWGAILSDGQADMTLITCGGTWDPVAHEYSVRWAAYLDKVG
jgi:sortase (surface protein transpeptidase)